MFLILQFVVFQVANQIAKQLAVAQESVKL